MEHDPPPPNRTRETVVILTLVLAGSLTIAGRRDALARALRPFGWLAVALVFAQALLGGITVLLRLPTPISFCSSAAVYRGTRRTSGRPRARSSPSTTISSKVT